MIFIQIDCVLKNADNHEGICQLGTLSFRKGELHSWSKEQVITAIEHEILRFYTEANGKTAEIQVRRDGDKKNLQTKADGEWNNNLLALPSFPLPDVKLQNVTP